MTMTITTTMSRSSSRRRGSPTVSDIKVIRVDNNGIFIELSDIKKREVATIDPIYRGGEDVDKYETVEDLE